MAIVCDRCKIELVNVNGEICDNCIKEELQSKMDCRHLEKVYLEPDLFEKFQKLVKNIEAEKSGSKKALGKFMSTLKTGFISRLTGKEINDPTPSVIIPTENSINRIQRMLNHNLSVYAAQHDMDTADDFDNWDIPDLYSDAWEQSLYQHVESVTVMDQDELMQLSDSVSQQPDADTDSVASGDEVE